MEPNKVEFTQEVIDTLVKSIKMYPVASSNISAIGYNENDKTLRVIFKGNSSYLYFNVEPQIWQQLSISESKGRTLNECVTKHKEKYKYIKLN